MLGALKIIVFCAFSAILRYEVGWFEDEKNSSSLVASRLASDALMVKAAAGDLLCTLAHNISLITTAFVIAFLLQWRIALVMISTFPLIVSSAVAQVHSAPLKICRRYLCMHSFVNKKEFCRFSAPISQRIRWGCL